MKKMMTSKKMERMISEKNKMLNIITKNFIKMTFNIMKIQIKILV